MNLTNVSNKGSFRERAKSGWGVLKWALLLLTVFLIGMGVVFGSKFVKDKAMSDEKQAEEKKMELSRQLEEEKKTQEYEANKQLAGTEEEVVINNENTLRGFFKELSEGNISLGGIHGEVMVAKVNGQTHYSCLRRYFTDPSGNQHDTLKIYVDTGSFSLGDVDSGNLGNSGRQKFLSQVKPGNPVLVRTDDSSEGLMAEAVILYVSGDCTF